MQQSACSLAILIKKACNIPCAPSQARLKPQPKKSTATSPTSVIYRIKPLLAPNKAAPPVMNWRNYQKAYNNKSRHLRCNKWVYTQATSRTISVISRSPTQSIYPNGRSLLVYFDGVTGAACSLSGSSNNASCHGTCSVLALASCERAFSLAQWLT